MFNYLEQLRFFGWMSLIDIIIVAAIFYQILILLKSTRAMALLNGVLILLVISTLSDLLQLNTLSWILSKAWAMLVVALPIVFQPELRRALEKIGRRSVFNMNLINQTSDTAEVKHVIEELVKCIKTLSENQIGALIVLEKETGIQEYIETGVKIDSVISAEFLISIFMPSTPLHDGAIIIRGDRVAAASCFLPLTQNPSLQKTLGTRHRAALGLSEVSDALIIVVSEETGIISIAQNGDLKRFVDEKTLRDTLKNEIMVGKNSFKRDFLFWR